MDRRRSDVVRVCACWLALCSAAPSASRAATSADSVRSEPWWKIPISSRARLDLRLTADEATAPWSWDAQSRSPLDYSRFMIDATIGDARTGALYAKGAASWQDADDADGEVTFVIEQGDYVFGRGDIVVRAFGDERRFFTGDLGTALMDDDVVDDFQHRIGVRAEGGTERVGGTLLVSSLDEGSDTQLLSYARAGTAWRPLAAAVSYQLQEGDDARDHAIVKAEACAFWKRASAVASYEQSGFGSGVFLPDMDDLENQGAGFVELRLARGGVGDNTLLAGVYRYRRVGYYYQNELIGYRPGSDSQRLGLYVSHRHYALDGRVVAFDDDVTGADRTRGVTASARAFLRDNSEMNVRGALVERTPGGGWDQQTSGVVHASYRRSLQLFMGGIDALVDDIGIDAATRVGAEARINWSATSALYLRWIGSTDVGRSDAVYARLEFRPSARTWVTLAYGRATAGDGPYFLEDEDALPTVDSEDVVTVTVRGDF